MNKIVISLLLGSIIFASNGYYGSTTGPVIIAGGIIKAKSAPETTKKYKRKDCPVCKGTGWYLSGDKIKKIECSYCEEEKGSGVISVGEIISIPPTAYNSSNNNCTNGRCKPRSVTRR